MIATLNGFSPYVLGAIRILTGLMFLEHGTGKLFGFPKGPATAHLFSMTGFEGSLETIGSLLLIIGFKSRFVAFLLSGEMAIGYWTAHVPRSFFPIMSGGEPAALFCLIFLYIFVTGPGAWSLDGRGGKPA